MSGSKGNARPGRRTVDAAVEALIKQIAGMNLDALRAEWRRRHGTEPPVKKSTDMLRRFLAWHIQKEAYGGFSAALKRRLWSLEQALIRNPDHQPFISPHLKPGTVLVREWKGVSHRVQVLESAFAYDGKRFTSLSEIARAITRARWSGPAFFGLRPQPGGKNEQEEQ